MASFETVLARCIREGLVGGEGFAVDASLIQGGCEPTEGHREREGLAAGIDRPGGRRSAIEVVPKFVSPADPAARWTGAHGGQAYFAYSTNYLIDVEHGISVSVVRIISGGPGELVGPGVDDGMAICRVSVHPVENERGT